MQLCLRRTENEQGSRSQLLCMDAKASRCCRLLLSHAKWDKGRLQSAGSALGSHKGDGVGSSWLWCRGGLKAPGPPDPQQETQSCLTVSEGFLISKPVCWVGLRAQTGCFISSTPALGGAE